ncbi:BBE domain-containing protein [Streptomyces sp. CC208A]|uniref:BBE domain-containing protein n=1 Tax=Streptomyces sp. CC208A TaxID=3044573 RepID=UPI0024A8644F|nr:BBE domain-containing protein [Streptomyces sp. CC208A]
MLDTGVPAGWHYYWKSTGLRELADPVIDTLVERAAWAQSTRSHALLFHLGGAIADQDPAATAFTRRDVPHELDVNAVWPPHQPIGPAERAWARDFVTALVPYRSGVHVNFLDHDDHDRRAEAFDAETAARLARVRHRYDPEGVLRPD